MKEKEIDINIKFLITSNDCDENKLVEELENSIKNTLNQKKYLDFISVDCWSI